LERDLMKQPLSEAEAVALGKRLGGIRELVAPKRRAEAEAVTDAKLAAWLAANPNFVRRPLIDTGNGLEAGFTSQVREKLKDL
jgi:arsenate reductase